MKQLLVRLTLVGLLACLACLIGLPTAWADDQTTLSNLSRTADGTVTGVLTVRAGNDSAKVDASSLRLSVGGKEYGVNSQSASNVERSVMLLIDRSGSMKDRMATVRNSVQQFLKIVPKDVKVGVVSFGDQATSDLAPTEDPAEVQKAVNALKPDGDTALYDAVVLAAKSFGNAGERSIILLSDGEDRGSTANETDAVNAIKAAGIRMSVIAFGTNNSGNLTLGQLAAAGQGQVKDVADAGVTDEYKAAAKALDSQLSWSAKVDPSLAGTKDVILRGTANGTTFSATGSVDFGAAPPSPTTTAPATPVPTPSTPPATAAALPDTTSLSGTLASQTVVGQPVLIVIASLALFAGILLLVLALLSPAFKSRRRERVESIEHYVTRTSRKAVETVRTTNVNGIAEQLVQLGDRVVEGRESTPRTVLLLQRADLPWRAGEWAVLRVIAVVVGMLLGILLVHGDGLLALIGALLGILIGILIPPVLLRFLAARRAHKFERQLPDVLTLLASSLSTGFSLPQALDAVSHDVAEPAAKEFSRAMAETRIGSNIEEALERLAERMDSKNMSWAAMAIEIQRKVGGNLAETLRTTASTLREREALFRHVRALSAEGRLSAWILVGLPVAIFVWMVYVNGEYISLLWKSLLGLTMLVGALVLMVIGVIWMRKVVEVEV